MVQFPRVKILYWIDIFARISQANPTTAAKIVMERIFGVECFLYITALLVVGTIVDANPYADAWKAKTLLDLMPIYSHGIIYEYQVRVHIQELVPS